MCDFFFKEGLSQDSLFLLNKRTHCAQNIEHEAFYACYKVMHMIRDDNEENAEEEKTDADFEGKAKVHDMHLRRGSCHKAQGCLNGKERNHDRGAYLDGKDKKLAGERNHLIQEIAGDEKIAWRNKRKALGKS